MLKVIIAALNIAQQYERIKEDRPGNSGVLSYAIKQAAGITAANSQPLW